MNPNNFNSNINRLQNEDNENNQILEQNQLDQLRKENHNYSFILQRYNIILREYQEKYGHEIFDKLIKEYESDEELMANLNQRHFSNAVRLIVEYEKKIKEQQDLIKNLREEKERLVLNNQKILEENTELQNRIENLKNDNDEMLKSITERNKQKKIKEQGKTFPNINLLLNKEEINKPEIDLEKTQNNLNNNMDTYNNNFAKTMNNFMKQENINLKEKVDYEEMITKLRKEIDNLKNQIYNLQNRLKQEMEETNKIEANNNLKQIEIDKLLIDNKNYKQQLNEYKEAYDSLEARKSKEVENIISELKDIMLSNDNYKTKNKNLEDENSSYKFENAKLKQENEGLKFDRDHLTKIIEDSNIAVQNATEKEKYIDNMIKNYKKKYDDLNLEKEKLNQRLQMKESQLNKINMDFGNLLKEKMNNYETLNNITKNKYEEIINNKENEIKELKASILTYKIDKDKYLNDCNLFKNEYDKIEQKFNIENDIYIKKYEEAQNNLNIKSNEYISQINELKMAKENLEHENKLMKDELKIYAQNEKKLESKIKNLEKNELNIIQENSDLRKNSDVYLKQNAEYIKEIERIKKNFNAQMEQEKEFYDNRIINLENVINSQKEKLAMAGDSALNMVKRQQEITEKYKTELKNTINYYQNLFGGNNEMA